MADLVNHDRRTFLRRGAMGAGAFWMLSLDTLMARKAFGSPFAPSPYGPTAVVLDETTGLPLLKLPAGFTYQSYGWTGDLMADEVPTPGVHDGMAVVDEQGKSGRLVLVRNHEVRGNNPAYLDKPSITYNPNSGGGTTNLIFDVKHGAWKKSWASLAGTRTNCAGGVTPWGTWITGEETGDSGHGWSFDVGPQKGDPTPLKAMGRFAHEAMMVDPATGYVYQTEDNGDNSGFYKFVPNVYGNLKAGGELFMLKIKGQAAATDLRRIAVVTTWDIEWVRISDPEVLNGLSVFGQGTALGGARFRRLEGAWWSHRTGYFLSTNGGPLAVSEGQVFEYDPLAETLKMIYVSPGANDLDNPDNLTVTPRGGLLLCEDAASGVNLPAERLIGLTLDGTAFTFGENNVNLTGVPQINDIDMVDHRGSEFAGACYSPDGKWLFVNIQSPGITFAITGPWGAGPL